MASSRLVRPKSLQTRIFAPLYGSSKIRFEKSLGVNTSKESCIPEAASDPRADHTPQFPASALALEDDSRLQKRR
jgi:hypothetical protein